MPRLPGSGSGSASVWACGVSCCCCCWFILCKRARQLLSAQDVFPYPFLSLSCWPFAIFTLSAANFQQLFTTPNEAGIANGGSSPLKINKDYDKMNVLIYVKLHAPKKTGHQGLEFDTRKEETERRGQEGVPHKY